MALKIRHNSDSASAPEEHDNKHHNKASLTTPVTARSVVIGTLLIPILIYWAEYTEIVAKGADLIAMSLIMAVFFAFLVMYGANSLLMRYWPRIALTRNELLTIYIMNITSIGICGIGMMQFLPHVLVGYQHYSTTINGWNSWTYLIHSWAAPPTYVINGFYDGHLSFFSKSIFMAWLQPILVWSSFIFLLMWCTYCLSTLLRRQWIHGEKLTFPIASVALDITNNENGNIWSKNIFWLGFGIAFVVECLAALHYSLGPGFPYIPIKASESVFNVGSLLTTKPWTGIGGLTLGFYPLVIGLTFLLSLDVSFSCWFFYLLGKLQNAAAVYLGYRDPYEWQMTAPPYLGYQGVGAFIAIAFFALVSAWPVLVKAHKSFLNFKEKYDDSDEPISIRSAVLGFWVSAALLVMFGIQLGISWQISIIFFAMYLLYSITISRLRVEAGLPWVSGPPTGVHNTIVFMAGPASFNTQTMLGLSIFNWFDGDYRCMSMQNQLDAMNIADKSKINARHLTYAIALAVVVATFSSWGSILHIYYSYGASSAKVDTWRTDQGHYPYETLQSWLNLRRGFNPSILYGAISGFITVVFLTVMRKNYVWWPFHPIGYAAAGTGLLDWIWAAILVGWLAKYLIIRYGGVKGYRAALPFFLGIIVGDYIVGPMWAIIYQLFHMTGYRTFPI